jgi:hypothetical protein
MRSILFSFPQYGNAMKVGLLHYHLKTGGVRGVLNAQIKALSQDGEFLVLTGDRAGADLPCQVAEIPGLDYDRTEKKGASPEEIAEIEANFAVLQPHLR